MGFSHRYPGSDVVLDYINSRSLSLFFFFNPTLIGGGREIFLKSMSMRMHFQVILKPILPYSITSILNEVRHSNTLFLAISFAFHCRPLGALVRFPRCCCCCLFFFCFFFGGGGKAIAMQV